MAKPKFVFECQECRKCCNLKKRKRFQIYYSDIDRWVKDQTLNRVFPHLEITEQDGALVITFRLKEDGTCPMLIENQCIIDYSKPINCSTVPLQYNGSNYIVSFKDCEGIGKGTMTKEGLKELRDRAQLDYKSRVKTLATLPILQFLFLQFFQKQSEEAMKKLSPEEREKLKNILNEEKKVKDKKEVKEDKKVKEVKEVKKDKEIKKTSLRDVNKYYP
ncbi:MAG: YkgJ family cysteine cluster protein [Candidatus Helarchaeota archaeon]